jgi:hypothetical protein
MPRFLIGSALLSMSGVFFFVACGQDPATAASGTSGTGGAPNCDGVYIVSFDMDGGEPCDICLHDNCCTELSNCRDKSCIDCVNTLLPSCPYPPRAVNDCLVAHCTKTCGSGT